MSKIKVLHFKTDSNEGSLLLKENDYRESQKLVGGYLECLGIDEEIDLWLNEEGKLDGLPLNFFIRSGGWKDAIVGDVFFASHNEEGDTVSLSDAQIEKVKSFFIDRRNMVLD